MYFFKSYSLIIFRKCTKLCLHHHSAILWRFYQPRKMPCGHPQSLSIPSHPSSGQPPADFLSL